MAKAIEKLNEALVAMTTEQQVMTGENLLLSLKAVKSVIRAIETLDKISTAPEQTVNDDDKPCTEPIPVEAVEKVEQAVEQAVEEAEKTEEEQITNEELMNYFVETRLKGSAPQVSDEELKREYIETKKALKAKQVNKITVANRDFYVREGVINEDAYLKPEYKAGYGDEEDPISEMLAGEFLAEQFGVNDGKIELHQLVPVPSKDERNLWQEYSLTIPFSDLIKRKWTRDTYGKWEKSWRQIYHTAHTKFEIVITMNRSEYNDVDSMSVHLENVFGTKWAKRLSDNHICVGGFIDGDFCPSDGEYWNASMTDKATAMKFAKTVGVQTVWNSRLKEAK